MKGLFFTDFNLDAIPYIIYDYFINKTFDSLAVKDGICLDVGAHVGIFSLWASDWAKTIYAVEPAEEHHQNLLKNIEYNGLKEKVIPIKKAVSNYNGKSTFYHNVNRTMFNLTKDIVGQTEDKEEVEVVTLKTLMDELKLEHVDLMKLDVEGEEYRILSHSEFDLVAPKIDTIMVEFHAWSGFSLEQTYHILKDRDYKIRRLEGDAWNIIATHKDL